MLTQLLNFLLWTVELCLFMSLWAATFYCLHLGLQFLLRKYLDSWTTAIVTSLLFVSLLFEILFLYQVERTKAMEAYAKGFGCSSHGGDEGFIVGLAGRLWQSFSQIWSLNDRCETSLIAVSISPLWKISPFRVGLSLISFTCVSVAEAMGLSVGSFLRGLIQPFPLAYHLPFVILALLTVVVVYLINRGYKWNFFFNTVTVEPSSGSGFTAMIPPRSNSNQLTKEKIKLKSR